MASLSRNCGRLLGSVVKKSSSGISNGIRALSTTAARKGGYEMFYRVGAPPPQKDCLLYAKVCSTVFWAWIAFHMYWEPYHTWLPGEAPHVYPLRWTDEELGIPAQ